MIIYKLVLHNFGVYAGTNTFHMTKDRPITLVLGLNGRGKTTILEAILIALYGKSSFAFSESDYSTYGKYLNAFVNEVDGTYNTYIELTFEESGSEYVIKRAWSSTSARTREKCSVLKDGKANGYLAENWPLFIETILPSGLSNYFFFDGEKIAEIAGDKTDTKMKEAIKTLLGINVVDRLEKDIGQVINSAEKKVPNKHVYDELNQLRFQKDQKKNDCELWELEVSNCHEKIEEYEKELEKLNTEYSSHGGELYMRQQDFLEKRKEATMELEDVASKLVSVAATELPLALLEKDLPIIYKQAKKDRNNRVMRAAVDQLIDLYSEFNSNTENSANDTQDFLDYVQSQYADAQSEEYYLSESSLFHLEKMIDSDLDKLKDNLQSLEHSQQLLKTKINEYDQYLSVDIDENALAKIYRTIKKAENKIISYEEELRRCEEQLKASSWEYAQANSRFKTAVETVLRELEGGEQSDRIVTYSTKLMSVFDEYIIRLQKRKIGKLSETITACYQALANKKKMIRKVEVDPETLDINYYSFNDTMINKQSLSAGEKQLMVISILWALAIQSKKDLPVIIDTPLSRMDSEHRMALVSTYFPKASEQVLILSTDSEIDENYYQVMKPYISNEYTLLYDEDSRSTSIKKGYLIGEIE